MPRKSKTGITMTISKCDYPNMNIRDQKAQNNKCIGRHGYTMLLRRSKTDITMIISMCDYPLVDTWG